MGVSVQQRGERLVLVATLPAKPGSGKTKDHQQRISLGIYANIAGLKRAERLARLVGIQLAEGRFDWAEWAEPKPEPQEGPLTCGEWVERYKAHLNLDEHIFTKQVIRSGCWRLPLDAPLTAELLEKIAQQPEADTRSRLSTVLILQRLADFAGVEVNLRPYQGRYSPAKVEPRDIPGDDEICRVIDAITNPQWRWIFALCATYGLRPHEAHHCQIEWLDEVPVVRVLQGKTGARFPVFPMPMEWVNRWGLLEGSAPTLSCRYHDQFGERTATAWRRQTDKLHEIRLDWTLYDLRHAYAIRCHMAQPPVPAAVAAQWMGHGLEVHQKTYVRWISDRHHLEIYRRISRPS